VASTAPAALLTLRNLQRGMRCVNYLDAMHHLVGVGEIARMLGISRQRINKIAQTDPAFPKPEAELMSGRVWKRADVERWAKKVGRLPGGRS